MTVLNLIRDDLRAFTGYASARLQSQGGTVFLNANESPWAADLGETWNAMQLNRYPEPQPKKLKQQLADLYGVSADRLLISRGSDELIDLLVRAFCRSGLDAIVQSSPTFGMYQVSAQLQGAAIIDVPLLTEQNFRLDVANIVSALNRTGLQGTDAPPVARAKIVFVCSPNNPTGNAVEAGALRDLIASASGRAVVVIDRAYTEFESDFDFENDHLAWLNDFDHVVQLRTLSKAHGLAGARIGVAMAAPELIQFLQRLMPPYPIATPASELASTAMCPAALAATRANVKRIQTERNRLREAMEKSTEVDAVFGTAANFLLVRFCNAVDFFDRAIGQGVVLRRPAEVPSLRNCLRISVGKPSDNDRLIALLGAAGSR